MWQADEPSSMATDGDVDTDRARVQTYVPSYQKDEWKAHADELDMSLSEFVRSMVQAGRRGFSGTSTQDADRTSEKPGERQDSGRDPKGRRLEDRVRSTLADGDVYDWDELVAAVTGDIEERLDETLQELQAEGEIRYSGREGGYVAE